MSFSFLTSLGMILSVFFGLAGLLFPEPTMALYGIAGWNEGTLFVGRLWGVQFLFLAACLAAVRNNADPDLQSRFSRYSAAVNAVAAAVVAHAAVTGIGNDLLWSSVVFFIFFMVSYGRIGFRKQ